MGRRKGKNVNKARDHFFTLHEKKKFVSWQDARLHYARYLGDNDRDEWLQIARGSGCELPAKIGHLSKKSGAFNQHAADYLDGYITYIVKPRAGGSLSKAREEYIY